MSADKRLDSGIEPEKQRLSDALGYGVEDTEILGYGVMYTVGADWNCIVPRDWLIDKMNELDLPRWMAPNAPTPTSAYKRMVQRMNQDWLDEYEVTAPRLDSPDIREPHRVEVELKEGDQKHLWHVYAEMFFSEEESKQDGGTWDRTDLGYFIYTPETQSFGARMSEHLHEEHDLYEVWEDVSEGGLHLFRLMQVQHTARDIRKMMYYLVTKYTNNVIKLRRSVYLFPAGMADTVEKMSELYAAIDQEWKRKGERVAIRTFEVLDTDDKRQWVEDKVRETLTNNLDNILESAFDEYDEGEAADQVVKIIKENLGASSETAEVYNNLLETQIRIEEALSDYKANLNDDEKEDIIERVLSQTDLD